MPSPDLTGSSEDYDWGVYNLISNGGTTIGQWRTLTTSEWWYVFYGRTTISGIRYAKAQITGTSNGTINGVVLLPDDWTASTYVLNNPNPYNSGSYEDNTFSQFDWNYVFQTNGAVFLPAAGGRYGTSLSNVGSNGRYWSSEHNENPNQQGSISWAAWGWSFGSSTLYLNLVTGRGVGQSVRLICPAEN